jgi:hypothetical protein
MYYVNYEVASDRIVIECNTLANFRKVGEAKIVTQAILESPKARDGATGTGDFTMRDILTLTSAPTPIDDGILNTQSTPSIIWSSLEQFVTFFTALHREKLLRHNLQAASHTINYAITERDRQRVQSTLTQMDQRLKDLGVLQPKINGLH